MKLGMILGFVAGVMVACAATSKDVVVAQKVQTDEEKTCAAIVALHLPATDRDVVSKVCAIADPSALAVLEALEAREAYEDGGIGRAVLTAEQAMRAARSVVDELHGSQYEGGGP